MKLRKKKFIIKKFLEHDIKTVLHGHLHESVEYHRKGIKFINAGGTLLSEKNGFSVSCLKTGMEMKTWVEKIPVRQIIKNVYPGYKTTSLPLFDEKGDFLSFPGFGISLN